MSFRIPEEKIYIRHYFSLKCILKYIFFLYFQVSCQLIAGEKSNECTYETDFQQINQILFMLLIICKYNILYIYVIIPLSIQFTKKKNIHTKIYLYKYTYVLTHKLTNYNKLLNMLAYLYYAIKINVQSIRICSFFIFI